MDGSEAQGVWTPSLVSDGEWAGWRRAEGDPFEVHAGPFYSRREASGEMVCAFRAEKKHMNSSGFMHGGCLATFADYAIFAIAEDCLRGVGSVTAALNVEFVDGAREGERIECRGQVVRDGASMVFVRGLVTTGERALLSFSAIIKKRRRRG